MTGWGLGHLLTLPLPQEAPPPLVPPQPAPSPPEEDKMPPYDEQTQAFIDGEGQAGKSMLPMIHTCRDPGNGPHLLPQDGHVLALRKPGELGPSWRGHLGPGESIATLIGPRGPLASSGCCLFVPPGRGGEPARPRESWPSSLRSGEPGQPGGVCPRPVEAYRAFLGLGLRAGRGAGGKQVYPWPPSLFSRLGVGAPLTSPHTTHPLQLPRRPATSLRRLSGP